VTMSRRWPGHGRCGHPARPKHPPPAVASPDVPTPDVPTPDVSMPGAQPRAGRAARVPADAPNSSVPDRRPMSIEPLPRSHRPN
jgi:hypothetical protein